MTATPVAQFWLMTGEVPSGPFTVDQVHAEVAAGRATWQTLACPVGTADATWRPLVQTAGIGPLVVASGSAELPVPAEPNPLPATVPETEPPATGQRSKSVPRWLGAVAVALIPAVAYFGGKWVQSSNFSKPPVVVPTGSGIQKLLNSPTTAPTGPSQPPAAGGPVDGKAVPQPPPVGSGPILDAVLRAFGKSGDAPEIADVSKAVGGKPKEARSDDGRLTLYWWDAGLTLTFRKERVVESATFVGGGSMWNAVLDQKSKPYRGEMPYGLTWDDGPDAVERKLGKPDPTGTAFAAEYKGLGVRLGYVQRPDSQTLRLDEVSVLRPLGPAPRSVPGTDQPSQTPADDAQDRAAEAIRKRGGSVIREASTPGNPVVAVDLGGVEVTDEVVKELVPLRHLTTLNLGYTFDTKNRMTDAGAKDVARLKSLTTLRLGNCRVSDAGMKELGGLTNLTALDLGGSDITDAGLSELARLPNLTDLRLGGRMMTDAGLKHLAPLTKLTSLSLATGSLATNKVTDVGLKELKSLGSLERLDLTNTKVANAGLKELAPLKKLSTLNLVGTGVTEAGVRELAGWNGLTDLSLGGAWVLQDFRDAMVKEIAALGRLNRLRLSGAELTDANLRELARLKSVTALVLDNCRVTGTGVRELTALPNLTSLDLTGTPVPDAVMTALQAALPKCTIRK